MLDLEERIAGLEALLANLIRVGRVSSVNPGAETARVTFADRDNVVSYDLRIVVKNSKDNKDFHTPDVGEDVLCLFLPSGTEAGFILGAYYPNNQARPASSGDKRATVFKDGTRVEYDRASNQLLVDASASSGTVLVKCNTAKIEAATSVTHDTPETILTGKLTVMKTVSVMNTGGAADATSFSGTIRIANGTVVADNIDLKGHGHNENDAGGRTSNAVP